MPGVQSFVAQRQQSYQVPSRQILGAQNRVQVPATNLKDTKEKALYNGANPNQPARPPVSGHSTRLPKEQSVKASVVQGGFDTDAESFDDTATISIGGSRHGQQGEGDGRHQIASHYGADTALDHTLGGQVFSRRGQEQPNHVQMSRQLEAEDSGEDGDQGNHGDSSDSEQYEEPDEERVVRNGILQELNSPGFSQYLQESTSFTTHAPFQPFMATPVAQSNLAKNDVVQHSQKPANPFMSIENGANSGSIDLSVNLKGADCQAHERVAKHKSGVPVQTFQERSTEQLSISAQQRELSDHDSSHLLSITSHQTLWPTRVAQDIVADHVLPQANEERPLAVQRGSVKPSDDDSFIDSDPNVDWRHDDNKLTVSLEGPRKRKHARDLDYSPDHLSTMTFQHLTDEPFNLPSDNVSRSVPQELSCGTLIAKMGFILENLKDTDAKLEQRRAFFSSLMIDQYEECANLMVQRFSAIMSKFTDARQQKRRAAKDFEEEVARREVCVRGKTTAVDKDLGRLKRGGEDVVRGATL